MNMQGRDTIALAANAPRALGADDKTERLTAYGRLGAYERTTSDYQSPALTACRIEHASGVLWTITRSNGHELSAADCGYLNGIDYLTDECEHSWTIDGPSTFTHVFVVIN